MTSSAAERIHARAREAQIGWAALDVRSRCARLARLRRRIAMQCESIAETVATETGKPLLDALSGDVMVALEMLRYYEAHAAKILRARRVGKPAFFFRGARFESRFEPHGVVLILGPSNYPFQLSMVPLVTALAAGNAVVLKCSEHTPATADLIARLCREAGFPPNLVQVLHDGPEVSAALIWERPDFVFFTGSSKHGRIVAQRCAIQLIPCVLELGGKDAALIFADCHLERAVEGIVYGAFSNGGRVCVGIKRAYVEASIYDEVLERLKTRIAGLHVAPTPDADLYPLSDAAAILLREQIHDALARGATLHCPRDSSRIGCEPALLTGVPGDARILVEECFGPVLCVAPFRDESHALALANDSRFALSGSVWTRDRAKAHRIATRISAGSCAVNDAIRAIANPHAPFGGNGFSGHGRYHGPEGLRAFSRVRTIMHVDDRRAREVNWFPFTSRTRRQLAGLLRFRHGQAGLAGLLNRVLMPVLLCAVLWPPAGAQSNTQTHLTIEVRLPDEAHGELAYLVFNSPTGFPSDREKAVRHGFLPIRAGTQELRIDAELPPGNYAVSVYEDLNGNHKLDHNLLGIPREPVGVSNNPAGHMGPPRFKDCLFHLGTAAQTITINLVRAS